MSIKLGRPSKPGSKGEKGLMRCAKVCWPCIVHDLVTAADLALPAFDWEVRMRALRRALEAAERAFSSLSLPSEPITSGHRALNEACLEIAGALPFSEQRRAANNAALWLCEKVVRPQLEGKRTWEERISLLLRWCAAGNCADFRSVATEARELDMGGLERRLASKFESAFSEGVAVGDLREIAFLLAKAERVVVVHDNCGEIAFDALLAGELRRAGKEVTSIVHGPVSSDADLSDAEQVSLTEAAEVLSSRRPTLGLILAEAGREVLEALRRADVVVIKGQANFYQFTEPRLPLKRGTAVVSIMRTKCQRTYRKFGLQENRNVIVPLRGRRKGIRERRGGKWA